MEKNTAESYTLEDPGMTKGQYERFIRQMYLPEIGIAGQKKLLNAKVLVIGVGGIGCPAAISLAGAGIGTIGLVDGDKVEITNLHRQFLHTTDRVGMNKAVSAKTGLNQINNTLNYITHETNVTNENILDIIKAYDVVIDATDQSKSRYLINDGCIIGKVPLVAGSALRWDGQLSVYGFKGSPCYRCIVPVCPANMGSCGDNGVIAMAPNIIGQFCAWEAMKIILGFDEGVIAGRMLIIDGLSGRTKVVKLRGRQPDCAVCGNNPTIKDMKTYDYDQFTCAANPTSKPLDLEPSQHISWTEFKELVKDPNFSDENILLDVRPSCQYNSARVQPSINIPMAELAQFTKEEVEKQLAPASKKTVYVMCRSGVNSTKGVKKLFDLGFANVKNVVGGIRQYIKEVDKNQTLPSVI